MDTETVGIIGLVGLLFVIGTALSIVFALARKPFERFIERLFPPSSYSGQISRGMRVTIDPEGQSSEDVSYSVNLGAGDPVEATETDGAETTTLSTVERRRYEQEWLQIRRLFHEAPDEAVRAADRLLKDVVKQTGRAQVSLGTMRETSRDVGDAVEMVRDVYRLAQNARMGARGIELATRYQSASAEELTQAMDYYRALFNEILSTEPEGTEPRSTDRSLTSFEEGLSANERQIVHMFDHEDERGGEPGLGAVVEKLEIGFVVFLAVVIVAVTSGAIMIMARMDEGSRGQGGRFYVAIIAVALLAVIDSQFGRILRRRAPGLTTSPAEQRYAGLSLIFLLIMTVVLIGLAWRLP
jgi:hypothetical protein